MPKYIIKTLGCKVNQYETEAISQSLVESGCEASQGNEADICIINTCTVTGKASMQSRQAIRQAIRSHPNARIIVTGCYAQTEPEKIRQISGVHDIVANSDKYTISELITGKGIHASKFSELDRINRNHHQDFFRSASPVFGHRTRTFLKIQDGCDAFCSYCIVPFARGRSRSMPVEMVVDNIQHLKALGSLEIVLTGIHLGAYGLDLTPKTSLFELLYHINKLQSVNRYRLSSIEPHELSKDIIELVSSSDTICDHFHIPLQSGNDGMLNQMNRPYSQAFFIDLIQCIHKSSPNSSIGVDVIIGFPGETEKEFNDTYSLISGLPVSYLHVFPFSPRHGTRAAALPDKVPPAVIKERSRQMRELGIRKKSAFYKKHIGKNVDILVESSRDNITGYLKGITSNYVKVLIDGPDTLKNSLVHTKIAEMLENMVMKGRATIK